MIRFKKLFDDDANDVSDVAGEPGKRRVGRPRGKHSDPDYVRMAVYLKFSQKRWLQEFLLDAATNENPNPELSEAIGVLVQGLIDGDIDVAWFRHRIGGG